MEACYAEGSKSRGDAVPQISLRPLAHQNCIRRDRIVAVAPTNGDPGQSFGLVSSFKLSQRPFRFLLLWAPLRNPLCFKSLADAWADTTTPHGKLLLTVLGGLAEFERELIRARTDDGRKRAKARGVKFGRPVKLTAHQRQETLQRLADGAVQAVWRAPTV